MGGAVIMTSTALGNLSSRIRRSSLFSSTKPPNYLHKSKKLENTSYSTSFVCCAAEKDDDHIPVPVQPQSATGQLLGEIMKNFPHLMPDAAEQQLERLIAERDEQEAKEREKEESGSGAELVLYKRISEVREVERRRAVEEVMYALIAQKFRETGADMVTKIPFLPLENVNPFAVAPTLPSSMEKELLAVHTEEARQMVREHLIMVMGGRDNPAPGVDDRVVIQGDKLRMGQVYAASIMYGYFLRRVDLRFQLEKTMARLQGGEGDILDAFEERLPSSSSSSPQGDTGSGGGSVSRGEGIKESPLKQYVRTFDAETLQKSAALRSREGLSVIEKQTEALFGSLDTVVNPEGGPPVAKVEPVGVTLTTLKRVVLEALAFGSFLWDVESFVDSRYGISQSEQ